ncbi:MAG: Ig-like domain repeat protein [Vicinamibacterales bacterium]
MTDLPRRRPIILSAFALLTFLVCSPAAVRAQTTGSWQFENVGQGNLIAGCVSGMTLAGFEYGPDGRPVIAWREENGCGGPPRVFWTRLGAGQWSQAEFLSDRRYQGGAPGDYAHQLALRPSDGNPFLIYADVGNFNEINTYRTDLVSGASAYLEGLVGPQNCAYVNYSAAFGSSDQLPQWATGLSLCNGGGPISLNGVNINATAFNPRASLAIGPDGTRHVLWNSSSDAYYSRFPPNAATPDLTTHLFNDLNRFGGEVRIAIDDAGVLHAIVRGPDISADWDLGAIVYLTSADGGNTWSSRQYVDPHDDPAVQNPWNGNSDLSFAVDADGVPAVAFWRWSSELWYARRDGPNGQWTQQLVSALPSVNPVRANQLRFDPNGAPVIAFYDPAIRTIRLARPVPTGVVLPIDVAVTATASPGVLPAGAATTFTLTVTNKGTTNLDQVELTNRLPDGAALVSASPAPGVDGRWTFALTSGASTTVTIAALAPFAEGASADVATVSIDAADDHPENNAAAAGIRVQPDQCFVPHGAGSGLLGWWRGDGSADNAVTGLPEGTNVFGNVGYERAVVGGGFKFDGASAVHAYHDNDNYYYPGDGSFTVEAEIKTFAPAGTIASRYECRSFGCGPTTWFLSLDGNGHLAGWIRDRTDHDLNFHGVRVINDGAFHHVALVLDRASVEARLYVDGAVDAVAPFTLGTISDSNGPYTPVVIGAYLDYSGNNTAGFTGVIDEVAIHSRALSASEIGQVAASATLSLCGRVEASAGVDVAVTVQAVPASVAPGGNASFLISVTNNGSTDLLGVNVDNVLDGGATLVDAAPNPQSAIGGFQNFNVGSLAKGEQKWIAVRVTAPPVPGTMSSQAHHLVDSDQNTLNDESRAVVQVVADACFVPPASLVGRWRADGDVTDATGGPAGSMVGGASFEVGRAGQAFRLQGNGSYVEIPDAPRLKPAQFTIAAWTLAPSFAQGGYDTVIAKGASGQDGAFGADLDSYWLGFANGYPILFTHHQNGGTYATQGPSRLQPMQWYHLGATFDGTTVRVYVNGVAVASDLIGSPIQYDSHPVPLIFGDDWQYGYANGADYRGLIDDVTIHDRALSAAEMQAMFDGSSAACVVVAPTATTTTVASSINPSASGQAMTFTATVAAVGATALTPTGDLAFVYVPTNTTLATITLAGGTAAFTTSALPEGTFNIRAIFTGNDSFGGSTATVAQVVETAPWTPIRNGDPETRPQFNGVGMIVPSATHGGCTATLISPFIVLTAAQCLIDTSPDPVFEFSLGAGRTARVTDIRVHPSFSTVDGVNLAFDVALAVLDRAAVASWTDINPATRRADPISPIVDGIAVGFGETGAGAGGRTSGTLQITSYVGGEDANFNFLPDAFIETSPGTANQMFCRTGTGGPLFFDDQVVGVASFRNVATCAEDGPGFYIPVARLADWIQSAANELGNRAPTAEDDFAEFLYTAGMIDIDVLQNDTDPDGDPLSVAAVENGSAGGTTSVTADGRVRYTPPLNFSGVDMFVYHVTDPLGLSSSATVTVAGIFDTSTTLTASPNPATAGRAVTLMATVSTPASSAVTPTGVVTFKEGATVLATVTLTNGAASFATSSLPPGDHQIEAEYDGAPAFRPSRSSVVALPVVLPPPAVIRIAERIGVRDTPIETSVVVSASSDSVKVGQPVTFTAIVMSSTAAPPAGTVTFTDGATELATVTLTSGRASLTTSSLSIGAHQIGAAFAAPGSQRGHAAFLSLSVTNLTVIRIAETILVSDAPVQRWLNLTASPNPVKAGQPLTLTATVNSFPSSAAVGTVTFLDGAIELATVALSNGRASFTTSSLPIGAHQTAAVDTSPSSPPGAVARVTVNVTAQTLIRIREDIRVDDGLGVGNTPLGSNVSVQPIEPTTGGTPVTVTFSNITHAGVTSVTARSSGPAAPLGFTLGTPPISFDIVTTAGYTPPITVCINYGGVSFQNPSALGLWHFENGAWVNRTVSQDAASSTICGLVNSLSPFAVFAPVGLEARMNGDGGITAADGRDHRFNFHLVERHRGVERGELNYVVVTPKSGKRKLKTDRFESASITAITFWDDPAFKPGKSPKATADSAIFTGTGTWNGAAGYTFEARATDAGEPGRGRDTFALTVRDRNRMVVATVNGTLTQGNIQSARWANGRDDHE